MFMADRLTPPMADQAFVSGPLSYAVGLFVEHDLFRKPVSTFRDHAQLTARKYARPIAGAVLACANSLPISSRGVGLANKKPCISLQPARRSSTRCSSVS